MHVYPGCAVLTSFADRPEASERHSQDIPLDQGGHEDQLPCDSLQPDAVDQRFV